MLLQIRENKGNINKWKIKKFYFLFFLNTRYQKYGGAQAPHDAPACENVKQKCLQEEEMAYIFEWTVILTPMCRLFQGLDEIFIPQIKRSAALRWFIEALPQAT